MKTLRDAKVGDTVKVVLKSPKSGWKAVFFAKQLAFSNSLGGNENGN